MNVRLRGAHQPQAVRSGEVDVPIDVPFRVDDDRFTGLLTPDDVGRLSESVVIDHAHKHRDAPRTCDRPAYPL